MRAWLVVGVLAAGGSGMALGQGNAGGKTLMRPPVPQSQPAAPGPNTPSAGPVLPVTIGRGPAQPFVRTGTPTAAGSLPIDQRQLHVKNHEGSWKLCCGPTCLREFASEQDAQQALMALRVLRITERLEFGAGQRGLDIYLSNGQAPRGRLVGLRSVPVQPGQMSVFQHGTAWWLIDAQRRFISFDKEEDARKALDVIRQHGFDEVFLLGRPRTVMLLFVRNR